MAEITPRRIMFEDLRGFAGLDYHDACCLLLSVRPVAGGMSPRESLEVMHRSSIMRNYVDIVPSKTNPSHFGDLQNASLNVMARLAARQGSGAASRVKIADHYRGPAAHAMADAFDAWGLSGQTYLNAVRCIDMAVLPAGKDRAALFVMLFVVAGCLQDPTRAAELVEDFLERCMGGHFSSTTLRLDNGKNDYASVTSPVDSASTTLGLILREGSVVRLPAYELSQDPEGTVIGYLPTGTNVIGAPDGCVSARHLRIWCEGGRWYAQGLGSTAGTVLKHGTEDLTVVEPPSSEAEPGREYPPVEIKVGDELCLGGKVTYIVARGKIG